MIEERRKEATKGFLSDKGYDPREAGALDVWFTYLYMKYASDLADGLSDLARADRSWKIAPEKFDPLAHLEQAIQNNRIADSLRELRPQVPEYERLRNVLAEYRQIQSTGGWSTVPAKVTLKPGQRSPHVTAIAKRLAATGDYDGQVASDGQPMEYNEAVQEAVKVFQRRHGLADDGKIGREVLAEMNVPVDQRIDQLEMNLERWRWLPRDLGDRYILVNIPEMRLDIYSRRDVATHAVGRLVGHCLGIDDRELVVDRQPDRHVVDEIARLQRPAPLVGVFIGLLVGDAALDVPQPVVAAVAAALQLAMMQ